MRTKSPAPLAISSKKLKEYLELKENEKKKKAEEIVNRKIQREAESKRNQKKKKDLNKRNLKNQKYVIIKFMQTH